MNRTDRVWAHANAAFAEADKAFAEAERLFREAPPQAERVRTAGTHHVQFRADTAAERWRLAKKFFKMGWAALFTGQTKLTFKDR